MNPPTLLFALAGAGLGNFSRTQAILEALDTSAFQIVMLAQGRAHEHASKAYTTFKLQDVTYGQKHFSAVQIVARNWLFPYRFWVNRQRCARIIDQVNPDVLVTDSDFYCFGPAKKRKIPIVSINSALATMAQLKMASNIPGGMFFSHQIIERFDALLQERYADRIICPVLKTVPHSHPRLSQVPPIVRRSFLESIPTRDPWTLPYDIAVMMGGSGIDTHGLDLRCCKGRCLVVGQSGTQLLPPQVEAIPFTENPATWLRKARVLVVQGGLNSVSEAIALRRPTVLVPIRHHAEQWTNVTQAQSLGLGVVSSCDQAGFHATHILDHYETYWERCQSLPISCDGALHSAKIIREFLHG